MSDRIPGSSWSNPIHHRGWIIWSIDGGPTPFRYEYCHGDYEPGAVDDRQGHARSVAHAMNEIDGYEDKPPA